MDQCRPKPTLAEPAPQPYLLAGQPDIPPSQQPIAGGCRPRQIDGVLPLRFTLSLNVPHPDFFFPSFSSKCLEATGEPDKAGNFPRVMPPRGGDSVPRLREFGTQRPVLHAGP